MGGHVEAGTAEKRTEVGMLTAILPYRAGKREGWTATRVETQTAVGVRIERAGQKTRMLFRKQGARGPASADAVSFDGPAAVVRR